MTSPLYSRLLFTAVFLALVLVGCSDQAMVTDSETARPELPAKVKVLEQAGEPTAALEATPEELGFIAPQENLDLAAKSAYSSFYSFSSDIQPNWWWYYYYPSAIGDVAIQAGNNWYGYQAYGYMAVGNGTHRFNLPQEATRLELSGFSYHSGGAEIIRGYDASGNLVSTTNMGYYWHTNDIWFSQPISYFTVQVHNWWSWYPTWMRAYYLLDRAPTANAGTDFGALAGDSFTLNGSGSDPDGDAISLAWSDAQGNALGSGATVTTGPLNTGDYTFTLTVTDVDGNTATDDVVVSVTPRPVSFQVSQGRINTRSKGVIPTVILSTPEFDATTVDPGSARFGPGNASEAHGRGHIEDQNGDGLPDLVLHFGTQDSGLSKGDTQACLSAATADGFDVAGCSAVDVK